MSRLESYIQSNPQSVPSDIDVFELFRSRLAQLFDQQAMQAGADKKAMDTANLLELLNTFLTFTLAMYPDRYAGGAPQRSTSTWRGRRGGQGVFRAQGCDLRASGEAVGLLHWSWCA